MYKIINLCSYMLMALPYIVLASQTPKIDVAKLLTQKQEWHRELIAKNRNLVDFYEGYLVELSVCNGNGDSAMNQVLGEFQYQLDRFRNALSSTNLNAKEKAADILMEQTIAFTKGLKIVVAHPEIELKLKCAADCLSRIVTRNFSAYTLDWTKEPPLRQRNASEIQSNTASVEQSKSKLRLECNRFKSIYGMLAAGSLPVAAVFTYVAVQNPTLITTSVASSVAAFTAYNVWKYKHLNNLSAPTDDEVYKHWSITLNPKFN